MGCSFFSPQVCCPEQRTSPAFVGGGGTDRQPKMKEGKRTQQNLQVEEPVAVQSSLAWSLLRVSTTDLG